MKLLMRVQLETLGQLPAELLTQLTGGKLRLTSQAARYLCEQQAVALRVVVIDQGEVVGVGRQTRMPPGFMRDVVDAVHDVCTEPLCERPARRADLDHASPWWPEGPDDLPGTTDVDNVGPLCMTTNQTPRRAGWQPVQIGDGRRRWTHPRSGLAVTTVPATWRPSGWQPPCHHPSCHHPPGHHPPHQPPGHHLPDGAGHHTPDGPDPGSRAGPEPGSSRRARRSNRQVGRDPDGAQVVPIEERLQAIDGTAPRPDTPSDDDVPF